MARRLMVAGLFIGVFCGESAFAQAVEIQVVAESTTPVAGAIVRLLGENGAVTQGLTSEAGRLSLRGPSPGSYRLRIDRIGYVGLTTGPFTLGAGIPLRMRVEVPSQRVLLPTLVTSGRSWCERNEMQGALAAALWEEVKKALTANVITQSQGGIPLQLRRFIREVDLGGSPGLERVTVSGIVQGQPFRSLPPARLAARGFMEEEGGELRFAAPDAALLLSEEFVRTHCFVVTSESGGLVGLEFEPIRGRRVPEISGTLWVDRGTSELRFLEYSYVRLPASLRRASLGGRVEFSPLPGGEWIVSYWHIQMPQLETRTARAVSRLSGYVQQGGRSEIAGDAAGHASRAIVRGRVHDGSPANSGQLEPAIVWIEGTTDTMFADSDGRFELAVDASGERVISVRHPRLGLLGEPTSRVVLLSIGDTTTVDFDVPPVGRFVREFCSPGELGVAGIARKADATPAPDWELQTTWTSSGGRTTAWDIHPRPNGLFGVCARTSNDTISIIGAIGRRAQAAATVVLKGEPRWVDLREWGTVVRERIAFPSAEIFGAERGPVPALEAPVLTGMVYDSTTGRGLAGAIVRFLGGRDSAVSDSTGAFTLTPEKPGAGVVVMTHPALGLLVGPLQQDVFLPFSDTTRVAFGVIPVDAVVRRLCGESRGRSGLLGIAFDSSGRTEESLDIRVRWRIADGRREARARSGTGGLYAFCDLPPNRPLDVVVPARSREFSGGSPWLGIGEFRWLELRPDRESTRP